MNSDMDNENEPIEEEMAAKVNLENMVGAECIACGSSLNDETGAMNAGSPELLESAMRAVGKSALSDGSLACQRCYCILIKLQRADMRWRGLRDQLLEVLLTKPPSPVDEHIEFCDVQIKNEADTASVGNYSPERNDTDSDDEPLYRCKENRTDENIFPSKVEELSGKDSEMEKKKYHKKHKRKSVCDNVEAENITKRTKSKRVINATLSKKMKENNVKFSVDKATNQQLVPPFMPEHQTYILKKPKFDATTSNTAAILNHLKSSGVSVSAKIESKPIIKTEKKKIFSCSECSSTFTTQARYDLHMVKHAASKGPFICEVCGASYKHKKACDIHVQMHKGLSPWKCTECGKIFPSKGALSRHEAIHTGTPNYQCDLCGKSFIHTSSFKMHKLSHSGIKPHSCSKCGLALMTKSHLKRHQRVHSGEKRHECNVCGKKFSERYNLYAHQKSHDGSDNQRQGKNYDCTVCESSFNRKHLLEKHMETVHFRVLESCLPKKPRNTMSKLLKQQVSTEPEEIKYTPMVTEPKVELVEVKPFSSSPPIDQINRNISSNSLTATTSASISRNGLTEEPNGDIISNHQSWKGIVNYHLTNDYPLRMHGVDYVGYLNRQ